MDLISAKIGGETPAEVYSQRLQHLNGIQAAEHRRERLLGFAKLVVAAATLGSAILLLRHTAQIEFLLAPVIVFVALVVLQEKLIRSLRLRARSIQFYERGLARLGDRWAGSGESGDRFFDPLHPYARDLDLFGRASLFELLCTARTRAGEETLAAWLLAPAPIPEIVARQLAIQDLKSRVPFREKLFSLGESVRRGVQPEALAAWGEGKNSFGSRWTRALISVLGILWLLSMVCWAIWGVYEFALLITLLNFAYSHRLSRQLDESADAIEKSSQDLKLLSEVLGLLEQEQFSAPKLSELQTALKRSGCAPSAAIRKLASIAEYLEHRRNRLIKPFDLFMFYSAHLVLMAERWQAEFGPAIRSWLEAVGEFEALTALSGFSYEHPDYVFPELSEDGPVFEAEGLAHPLLPAGNAVSNDLKLGDGLQLIILSGPNMAGKSTFIRSVGVNAVLAQCGAPVRATRLRMSPLTVAASICILDSLSGGVSRFYAEINRIKLISDLTREPVSVLFLLDELLSGTNSHDRLEGTKYVVESLTTRKAIGIVSTHDLALTGIPESMGARATNLHFEDRLEDGKLIFDYKLKPGIVKTSNALELMRSIGLGVTR